MRLKTLLSDSIVYGGSAVASKAMGLATFPLLLAELDVSEYGALDLFGYCLSLAAVVAAFGLDSALGRLLHDHEPADRQRFVSTVLLLQAVSLFVIMPVLAFSSWFWMPADTGSIGYIQLAMILIIQLPFSVVYSLSVGLSQWTFSRRAYLFLTLGFTVTQASIIVVGSLTLDLSVLQIAAITSVGTIIFGCAGLTYLSSYIVLRFDPSVVWTVLRFAWPFGAIGLLGAVGPVAERSIVFSQLGPEELGLYSVAGKLASMMAIVSIAFQTAWGPFAVAAHNQKEESRDIFASVLWLVTIGMIGGAFGLAAVSGPLLYFFSAEEYIAAVPLVLPLALAGGVSATAAVMQVELLISKKSHLNLVAEVAFFGSLVVLAGFGAARFGSTAVASATLVANIIRCYLLFVLSDGVLSGRSANLRVWAYILGASGTAIVLSGLISAHGVSEFSMLCAGFAMLSLTIGLFVFRSLRVSQSSA